MTQDQLDELRNAMKAARPFEGGRMMELATQAILAGDMEVADLVGSMGAYIAWANFTIWHLREEAEQRSDNG